MIAARFQGLAADASSQPGLEQGASNALFMGVFFIALILVGIWWLRR